MKRTLTLLTLIVMCCGAWGQANRHLLRYGNRSYNKEDYDNAEVHYRRALESDSMDYRGQYNLGNNLYRQKKYDEAARHYDMALPPPQISDQQRAKTLHNKGNAYLKAGMENQGQGMPQLQQAVQAYQEALKIDPKNNDTRYNLAYARRLLQQAQQQQQQGGEQNQQQKDQNQQDKQDGGQNQQNQQNKQEQSNDKGQQQPTPNDDNQENENSQKQKRANPMEQRKQDADRMLEAMKNNERQSLKNQIKKMQPVTGKHSDKDW